MGRVYVVLGDLFTQHALVIDFHFLSVFLISVFRFFRANANINRILLLVLDRFRDLFVVLDVFSDVGCHWAPVHLLLFHLFVIGVKWGWELFPNLL